ncbi:restriction endonuclease [Clostridium paraputrificum]|uniref:restriction endonuclease n=2 Tax=Clostridium paraputrificum TaxID=29363 RepID=UPI00325A8641
MLENEGVKPETLKAIESWIQISIRNRKELGENTTLDKILSELVLKFGLEVVKQDGVLNEILNVLSIQSDKYQELTYEILKEELEKIIIIKSAKYFDLDQGRILHCSAVFNNKFIALLYNDILSEKNIMHKGLIDIKCDKIEGGYRNEYSVYIEDISLILSKQDKDILLSYYKEINNQINKELEKDLLKIKDKIKYVPDDILQIIDNFIEYFPKEVLLNRYNRMAFEHMISFNNPYSKSFVDINEKQRNQVINELRKNKDFYVSMQELINELYYNLVKIVSCNLMVDNDMGVSITWNLIKRDSIKYCSDIWEKENGMYFKDVEEKSMEDLIRLYCRIDSINPKDMNTIGMFSCFLINNEKNEKNLNFIEFTEENIKHIIEECDRRKLELFEKKLSKSKKIDYKYTIDSIDIMTGYEFEKFISELFRKMGYSTNVTKGSGDQGSDVVIEKSGIKIGVQAKCYSGGVTNKAIQETVAGLKYYGCEKGIIVTNNFYTNSAIKLAEVNNIVLWDRNILKQKIEELFH